MQTELAKLKETLLQKRVELNLLLHEVGSDFDIDARILRGSKPTLTSAEIGEMIKIIEEIVEHFTNTFMDENGKLIKFTIWKAIFNAEIRNKFINTAAFMKDIVIRVINIFKD